MSFNDKTCHSLHTYQGHSGVKTASNTTPFSWLILEGDFDPVDGERVATGVEASTVVVVELFESLNDESIPVPLHLSSDPQIF